MVTRQSAAYAFALLACLAVGIVVAAHAKGSGAPNYLEACLKIIPLAAASVAATLLVALVVSRLGHRARISGAIVAGLAFALTLPAQTAILPAAIAMTFGWLIGREVFGSSERSFVHPAVLGHFFLTLTWPQSLGTNSLWLPPEGATPLPWSEAFSAVPGGAIGASSALVCLICGLVLVVLGRLPWRILASLPIGMAVGLGVLGRTGLQAPDFGLSSHLVMGSVLFGVIFLASDPHSSPTRKFGHWAHGMLIGFVIILLRLSDPAHPDGTMAAILVASIFAPLFDHAAAAGRAKWPRVET